MGDEYLAPTVPLLMDRDVEAVINADFLEDDYETCDKISLISEFTSVCQDKVELWLNGYNVYFIAISINKYAEQGRVWKTLAYIIAMYSIFNTLMGIYFKLMAVMYKEKQSSETKIFRKLMLLMVHLSPFAIISLALGLLLWKINLPSSFKVLTPDFSYLMIKCCTNIGTYVIDVIAFSYYSKKPERRKSMLFKLMFKYGFIEVKEEDVQTLTSLPYGFVVGPCATICGLTFVYALCIL